MSAIDIAATAHWHCVKMRILHVIPALAPRFGGPPKVVMEMCRELAKRGEQVAIYTTNFDGPGTLKVPLRQRARDESGVEVTYFPVYPHRYYTLSFPLALALKRNVSDYDIVHIHSLYRFATTAAAYYCRKYSVPYVMQPHGTLDPFMFRRHRLRKSLYEALFDRPDLEKASAVHFTTQEELELARAAKFTLKGEVVPLGVTVEKIDRKKAIKEFYSKWPDLEGKRIILFLGRLNFKKGLDLLVRAFANLCRMRNDIHLFIAGPDDEGYGGQVRKWLQEEGVFAQATFSGMILGSEKAAAFAASDVFVLPSYSENFGVAVVEALGSGLPIVISNRVNIWREVAQADAGIVINCDSTELERALVRLLDEPGLSQQMSEAGPRLARDSFSWRTAGDRLLEVYRGITRLPLNGGWGARIGQGAN
jgi:glycosyltransferase involved in cell wall biosynthesis